MTPRLGFVMGAHMVNLEPDDYVDNVRWLECDREDLQLLGTLAVDSTEDETSTLLVSLIWHGATTAQ